VIVDVECPVTSLAEESSETWFGVEAVLVKAGDETTVYTDEEATAGGDLSGPGEKEIRHVAFRYDDTVVRPARRSSVVGRRRFLAA
jgi:hypothetical protein